ncbi:MAG: ABC transporter ATP-binding protein [Gammaproteobacteria bacterium]|nr:ABC transporter ATP-binding protein [Gammaproteobacteria bacterium]
MLELVDIEKTFVLGSVEIEVLRKINLEVRQGDLLSIMGPSGSGKSTLMNILGLLDLPTTGKYLLKQRDVSSMNDDELSLFRNQQIGFIFQSFNLMPQLTALENVGVPLAYRGIAPNEARQRARALLEKVGLGERADHMPSRLSGGQKQRVAIARALVGAPGVILADEPTGALDSATAQEVMELLIQLNENDHITIVIITHDSRVASQCARQTYISDGVLRETTPVEA